ncbi:PASTA domain-containing protein [Cytophagaceae bacterium DM2B3-1]|uniref:PASTA domain-containing protein n=1 Tax=Xanthocytophaga flava TaxID=3048013 RepID=A0ABT7CGI9_9BACT|nr:PASTA domain-containing protein [Xanthocytophaga flavus]MDJ1492859.1 PASTA domain-containing protein [Xanthocytophaga flavus]
MADTKFIIKTNNKRDLWIQIGIVVLLSLIILLIFFFIYLPWTTNHGESITVPDLRGMKLEELEEFLDDKDLRYEVQDSTFDLNMPPLSIKEQYPKANSKVKAGRKIYLTVVAKNPRMVTMPNLKDMSLKSAEMTLKNYKLIMGSITLKPYLGSVVLEQAIAAGQKVPEGTHINLVAGDGANNKEFTTPDLIGKTEEEAKFEIAASGLILGSTLPAPGTPGTITKQMPAPGTPIRTGDIIDIWITSDAPTATPDQQQEPNL